ncbi:hypothetical protein F5Y14DRAFT_453236 [Nemania sp. NC0429]|nr:hypothetical protein F5Y14DRAFT_453236 [Nemania sp. NC0429]
MNIKWTKKKTNVDYRYRWPTQQTLVESRVSIQTSRSERRWKLCGRRLRLLRRKSSPGPGKSTHPYDTGIGERRESDSRSSSRSAFTAAEVRGDGRTRWKKLTRTSYTTSAPAPAPKYFLAREEQRPETPKTPIQALRTFVHPHPRSSPFPRSRTATSLDPDKPAVPSTRSKAHVPPPPPAQAGRPVERNPRVPWARLRYFAQGLFRRRSLDWQHAARS